VINLGSILVGNATLVVANVLTCNNHSPPHIVQCAGSDDVKKCMLVSLEWQAVKELAQEW
jgi:hypothetical protein